MISKWKNIFLNLLKVGGLVATIALSGASLGVAVQTSAKNTEFTTKQSTISDEITNNDENTSTINSGALGLYGGFKYLNSVTFKKELRLAKQEILGIEEKNDKREANIEEITIEGDKKEVEILDLLKVISNLEWISKQLKHPNQYTSKITKETLHKAEYKQQIMFVIKQKEKIEFDDKQLGVFLVEFKIKRVVPVQAEGNTPPVPESWNFVFELKKGNNTYRTTIGTFATSMPPIPNSEVFKTTLNERAIIDASFQILLWKKSGTANANGTDFNIAIMLNKKTGKVFIWARTGIIIHERSIIGIAKPSITL